MSLSPVRVPSPTEGCWQPKNSPGLLERRALLTGDIGQGRPCDKHGVERDGRGLQQTGVGLGFLTGAVRQYDPCQTWGHPALPQPIRTQPGDLRNPTALGPSIPHPLGKHTTQATYRQPHPPEGKVLILSPNRIHL